MAELCSNDLRSERLSGFYSYSRSFRATSCKNLNYRNGDERLLPSKRVMFENVGSLNAKKTSVSEKQFGNGDNRKMEKKKSGLPDSRPVSRSSSCSSDSKQHKNMYLGSPIGNLYIAGTVNRDIRNFPSKPKVYRNEIVPNDETNQLACKDSNRSLSNHHVLGFGKRNYGHGNIINGMGNMEASRARSSSSSANTKKGEYVCLGSGGTLSSLNAEELKNAGNDAYRKGCFAEAIAFYDTVIDLCPMNAPCHSNKAAALAGLGRISEAVKECQKAIKFDPSYLRAHYRLGTLYTRLGKVEDARWHFKLSGMQSDSDMSKLLALETHLINIRKAQGVQDWNRVLIYSSLAIEAGADSSSQLLAFKAEALLKLNKAKEALDGLVAAKNIDNDRLTQFYRDACLLIVETQIYMALGRFEDGIRSAEQAFSLDCKPESLMWLRKAQAVTGARRSGNEFFKEGKYLEACISYEKGLVHAPTNSILLSNRAACMLKLGQWEKAIKDCDSALINQPSYTKALLRRAHCHARLEHWEEALRDYEILSKEMPQDLGIARSLSEIQFELKKSQEREAHKMQCVREVMNICNNAQFVIAIKSAGLMLLQFFRKSDERCRQLSSLVNELCHRYPSWSFLKVDVEENPDLAKSERVKFVPVFRIYKNGLKLREILSPNQQILEFALNHHSR
ncbi:TPR repeat-containing thioredoxin TTL1 [Amborella trichopoda]|uniref:Thioredoxin domain-containing protein n=1 Tax=Amborella trichopoda TaxID=13333 RepID=W1PVY8_AMBTC|nr:TPR repeat-containing thioredoxin TTL1 [Amborella trichopoda]ERN11999.1 hypothetical protein AMTR_s00165p00033420 [Amborella trichopoda]|eukprot:XP_006850418.3 TPR repeat-containing thioredoxin TTL1 [Amborella trichopoda]